MKFTLVVNGVVRERGEVGADEVGGGQDRVAAAAERGFCLFLAQLLEDPCSGYQDVDGDSFRKISSSSFHYSDYYVGIYKGVGYPTG
jgi:hypothetical protein